MKSFFVPRGRTSHGRLVHFWRFCSCWIGQFIFGLCYPTGLTAPFCWHAGITCTRRMSASGKPWCVWVWHFCSQHSTFSPSSISWFLQRTSQSSWVFGFYVSWAFHFSCNLFWAPSYCWIWKFASWATDWKMWLHRMIFNSHALSCKKSSVWRANGLDFYKRNWHWACFNLLPIPSQSSGLWNLVSFCWRKYERTFFFFVFGGLGWGASKNLPIQTLDRKRTVFFCFFFLSDNLQF